MNRRHTTFAPLFAAASLVILAAGCGGSSIPGSSGGMGTSGGNGTGGGGRSEAISGGVNGGRVPKPHCPKADWVCS